MVPTDPYQIPLPEPPLGLTRPYVVVNCAASADGKLALPDGRQTRISSDDDIAYVHRIRNWADAVVVGINTVLKDDPKLTVKEKYVPDPEQPIRVVVDSCCRTPAGSQVLIDLAPTIIAITGDQWPSEGVDKAHVDVVECGDGKWVELPRLIQALWDRGVRKIMVEGGGTIIASFISDGLVDEFLIFIGDMIIGGKGAPTAVRGRGAHLFTDIRQLDRVGTYPMESGIRLHYRLRS